MRPGPLILVIAIMNVASFLLFGLDKRLARAGMRRVPEKFLFFALFAGPIGGIAAMRFFHHKTRKAGFQLPAFLFGGMGLILTVWALVELVRKLSSR